MSDTRARILATATRQLLDRGYAAFTVASVREELRLSSGSMFHAYPSKAALAAAVYVEGMADYQRAAMAGLAISSDPEQTLRCLIDTHLGWVQDHPGLARFLFSTLPGEVVAEAAAPLAQRNATFYDALDRFYGRMTEAGLMGPLDRRVAHAICIGPAQEYCRQWTRDDHAAAPRELSSVLAEVALAAIRTTTALAVNNS
ncbi:MAG TPA: TetR/AcrR family transcriptional regulator [Acidimicrobiia bacterium]|nr:TetR/AcrR family transcriptional regulator [Acidimicrobiia bacterium]